MIAFHDYVAADRLCQAAVVRPDAAEPRPAVLIAPTIRGPTEQEIAVAERLAQLGHVAIVIDLYGRDRRGLAPEAARAEMDALLADRALLRRRLLGALDFARTVPGVDASRLAVIGYCFGGLCALDAARAGAADLRGVVSIHGVFPPLPPALAAEIRAKVLVLHGWDDPLAGPDAVRALADEMTAAGVDWQIHLHGGVGHSFTNPQAAAPGMAYHPVADRRSFEASLAFLAELFR